MPAPEQNLIVTQETATTRFDLEPARNAIYSLVMVARGEELSGLPDWVTKTHAAMSDEERRRHMLVIMGLHYAAAPERSWPSFSEYVDHLAALPPAALQDKIMNAYLNLPCREGTEEPTVDKEAALASVEDFLEFLEQRFSAEHIDVEVESEAYRYVMDPPALQTLLVSHLRAMWDRYLAAEWTRVEPMLLDSIRAFRQLDLEELSLFEAAEFVTGQSLAGGMKEKMIGRAQRLVFVPSAHVGPYMGMFNEGETLGILFGARLPAGARVHAPDLSRAEILVRLSALADDTRLRILRLLAEEGELRSQEIMRQLELSQSATSRHLKQLSATGYLSERRCEGAKCYALNSERVQDTLDAVGAFLAE